MGPENSEEKNGNLWKKLVGGYQITPGTNFRHTFHKYLPDPPEIGRKNPKATADLGRSISVRTWFQRAEYRHY